VDAINLLANIALPTAFGGPAVALQPGQVVQALVLDLLQSGAFRLQLPQAVLDVRSDVPLTPGSTVTLAVKGSGSAVRFDILSETTGGTPQRGLLTGPGVGPAQGRAADPQAVRRPIGEAIIIGRTNLPEAPAPISSAPPAAPAPNPATETAPARALAEAVRGAAARQGGLGPLFADATQAATVPALPAPVRDAVAQLLGFRVPLTPDLTAADIKQAFVRSGVLLEPQLAAAGRAPAEAANGPAPFTPAPDLKAALLVLRQAVKAWVAQTPQPAVQALPTLATPQALTRLDASSKLDALLPLPASAAPPLSPEEAEAAAKVVATALLGKAALPPAGSSVSAGPPPPYRGAPLAPQAPVAPALAEDMAPRAVAEKLIAGTDAALARQTLLQVASLPDAGSLDAPRDTAPRWTFEVPFATSQGTGVVPFEISRDGRTFEPQAQGAAWRARFSLDLEPMGPVHALVTLTGERASVTLWAERAPTASQLNENARLLGDALRAAELQPSELSFRVGSPRATTAAAPGRFMDRAS
jgi:hypothetical protein